MSVVGSRRAPLAQARYLDVKADIREAIAAGRVRPGDRLPSESQLVARFALSRPTVNRALRELQHEGLITRVAGVGSFVAEAKHDAPVSMVQDIAEEIHARGQRWDCVVHQLSRPVADGALAHRLQLAPGTRVLRSIIVHRGDGVPLQIEDRVVNPRFCPDYLDADFERESAHRVLSRAGLAERVEHAIEAVLPEPDRARLLGIGVREPCLSVHRRTFAAGLVASAAHLLYPGSRYRITGGFDTVAGSGTQSA